MPGTAVRTAAGKDVNGGPWGVFRLEKGGDAEPDPKPCAGVNQNLPLICAAAFNLFHMGDVRKCSTGTHRRTSKDGNACESLCMSEIHRCPALKNVSAPERCISNVVSLCAGRLIIKNHTKGFLGHLKRLRGKNQKSVRRRTAKDQSRCTCNRVKWITTRHKVRCYWWFKWVCAKLYMGWGLHNTYVGLCCTQR